MAYFQMLIDELLKTLFIYILHLFIFMAIKKNKVLFFWFMLAFICSICLSSLCHFQVAFYLSL